ncbi:uncharacterized protein LOC124841700 [Vigna umbellata]|uniref:uncharacterized protein LOC124841700 n=1 Tax=Vigna umbellata TaxID=87088 RepID=UPI001F5EA0D5|nr:uncharacterized protein LOC124841700 [Vigna umbellata]
MEESVAPKRPREEPQQNEFALDCDDLLESSKRHKPYNHILSLLESDEDDSTQDLSPLITALQQEITNFSSDSDTLFTQQTTTGNNLEDCSSSTTPCSTGIVEEHDKEMVMRHLLQASDDELGIPNKGSDGFLDLGEEDPGFNAGDMLSSICDGLLEFEDETANYYELLQSQLFL